MARQHLYTRLAARGWPVLYSTGPNSFWGRGSKKWNQSPWLGRTETVTVAPGCSVIVDRPGKLMADWPPSARWNDLVLRCHAGRLSRALPGPKSGARIAHIWHPRFWPYFERLGADYLVFHIHDLYHLSEEQERFVEKIAQRADLIISVAENMARHLFEDRERVRLLPHGVDFQAMQRAAHLPCPADLATIPHPRIGYTGKVNLKLDFEGLAAVAEARPKWNWILVGSVGTSARGNFDRYDEARRGYERLRRCENVHYLGVKSREEVHAYIHHCDVTSLFYRFDATGYWAAGYPTKLHEYLATGKPIISSNLENVRPFSHVVGIASTTEEWIAAIERALQDGGPGCAEERRSIAQQGDWEYRADTLEGWLKDMIAS